MLYIKMWQSLKMSVTVDPPLRVFSPRWIMYRKHTNTICVRVGVEFLDCSLAYC